MIITIGKLINYIAGDWRGVTRGVLQTALFTVLFFKCSVKTHCSTYFTNNLRDTFFKLKIIINYNSYKFTSKYSFIALLSFCKNLKQEKHFKVWGLVTKKSSVFVYSESRSISKSCWIQKKYKGILLHVAPVRIIFSWCNTVCETLSFIKVTT